MDRESYLDGVRQQYLEKISAAYMQCEHGRQLNLVELAGKLTTMKRQALKEGLGAGEFDDMVFATVPGVQGKIDLTLGAEKKAA